MNVQVFQHVSFEGPGQIADWCRAGGHTLRYTQFYDPDHELPSMDTIDLLVIMGGPMSVHDEAIHPWLVAEKAFLKSFLSLDKPVLGICLGAQLLAVCSGADVAPAPQKEIGWFPVRPTADAAREPWLYSLLEKEPVLFHWHGERFGIPAGARNLVVTDANDNQAFLLPGRKLGLQFHPELDRPGLERMVDEGREELREAAPYIQPEDRIFDLFSAEGSGRVLRGILEYLTHSA